MPRNNVFRTPKAEPRDEYEDTESPRNAPLQTTNAEPRKVHRTPKGEPEEPRTGPESSSRVTIQPHLEDPDRTPMDTKRGVREPSHTTTPSTSMFPPPIQNPTVPVRRMIVLPPKLTAKELNRLDADERFKGRNEYHIHPDAYGFFELSGAEKARVTALRINEIPDDHSLFLAAVDDQKKVGSEINEICRDCVSNRNRVYMFAALAVLEFLLKHGCGYISIVVKTEECSEIERAMESFKGTQADQIHLLICRIEEALKVPYERSKKDEKLLNLLAAFQNGAMRFMIEGSQQPAFLRRGKKMVLKAKPEAAVEKSRETRAPQSSNLTATVVVNHNFHQHQAAQYLNSGAYETSSRHRDIRGEPSWNSVCNQNGVDKNSVATSGNSSNSVDPRIQRSQQNNEYYNFLDPRMGTLSQGNSISYHPQYNSFHLNDGVYLQRVPDRVVEHDLREEAPRMNVAEVQNQALLNSLQPTRKELFGKEKSTRHNDFENAPSQGRKTSSRGSSSNIIDINEVAWRGYNEGEEPMSPTYTPDFEDNGNTPTTSEKESNRDSRMFSLDFNRDESRSYNHSSLPLPDLVEQPRSQSSSIRNLRPVESDDDDDKYQDLYNSLTGNYPNSSSHSIQNKRTRHDERHHLNAIEPTHQNRSADSSHSTSSTSTRYHSNQNDAAQNDLRRRHDRDGGSRSGDQSRSNASSGQRSQERESERSTSYSSSSRSVRSTHYNTSSREYHESRNQRSSNSKRPRDERRDDSASSRCRDDESRSNSAKRHKDNYNDYLRRTKH